MPFEVHAVGRDGEEAVHGDRARGGGHRVVHPDRGGAVGEGGEDGGAAGGELDARGGVLDLELRSRRAGGAVPVADREATAHGGEDADAARTQLDVALGGPGFDGARLGREQHARGERGAEEAAPGQL
nr:hypothetical protein GCM10025732_36420 [Glycomyces mayteni]